MDMSWATIGSQRCLRVPPCALAPTHGPLAANCQLGGEEIGPGILPSHGPSGQPTADRWFPEALQPLWRDSISTCIRAGQETLPSRITWWMLLGLQVAVGIVAARPQPKTRELHVLNPTPPCDGCVEASVVTVWEWRGGAVSWAPGSRRVGGWEPTDGEVGRRWEAERCLSSFSKTLVHASLSHWTSLTKCKDKIIKNLEGMQIVKPQVQLSSEHGTLYNGTNDIPINQPLV